MMLQALPEALLRASYKQCLIDAHIEVEVEEELNYNHPPTHQRVRSLCARTKIDAAAVGGGWG